MEVFDITNTRYNEKISHVPWHFVKSSFHCNRELCYVNKINSYHSLVITHQNIVNVIFNGL